MYIYIYIYIYIHTHTHIYIVLLAQTLLLYAISDVLVPENIVMKKYPWIALI